MTVPFRAGLLLLGALLLVTAAVAVWRGGRGPDEALAPEGGRADEARGPGEPAAAGSGTGPGLGREGPTPASGPPVVGPGVAPGLREPMPPELTTPEERRAALAAALARRPLEWAGVIRVLQAMAVGEALDPAARARLVEILRVGDRNGALMALPWSGDPALLSDLVSLIDEPDLPPGARRVALQVLGQMRAGEPGAVVRELEARLGKGREADSEVLHAIAQRGGAEGMRAVTEYVLRDPATGSLGQVLTGRFDLARDAAAQAVLADALGRAATPQALETLVRLAGQPGASGVTAALLALDRDAQPQALRERVLESLSQLGDLAAVEHLLRVSGQPGHYGEQATFALANLASATPEARAALVGGLERAGAGPQGELARGSLLESLGRLQEPAALPAAVEALRDSSDRVRNSALRSLQGQGTRARAHVEEVAGLFESGSVATRLNVVNTLAALGGPVAVARLEAIAQRSDLTPTLQRTLPVALQAARGAQGMRDPEPR